MLFTFITEYQGGTYIDQISGDGLSTVVSQWRGRIVRNDAAGIPGMADGDGPGNEPTPVSGTVHCWCHCCRDIQGNLLLVHIVRTEPVAS